MSIAYAPRVIGRSYNPCTNVMGESYGECPVIMLIDASSAIEHRKKPDPLTFTNRSQWRLVSHPHVERRDNRWREFCNLQWRYLDGYWNTTWFHRIGQPGPGLNVEEPHWEAFVRNRIQSDLVSFADTIGEWRESVKLLDTVTQLSKRSYHEAKNRIRRSKDARRWRTRFNSILGRKVGDKVELWDLVSAHLAVKFGILPQIGLISDVLLALNEVQALGVARVYPFNFAATERGEQRISGIEGSVEVVETCSVRGKCYCRVHPGRGNFTSGNLLESIWAGTRLSFMLDWFVDVGGYLKALTPVSGIDELRMYRTVRRNTRWIDRRHYNQGSVIETPGKTVREDYSRVVGHEVPLPRGVVFRPTASWGKLLTSVEILSQLKRNLTR